MFKKIFKWIGIAFLSLFILGGIVTWLDNDNSKQKNQEIKEDTTEEVVTKSITKSTFKNKNDDGTIITRVTKNKKTGEYILQVLVPENADHDEIYRVLMDTSTENRKEFIKDKIMIVAYSDEEFMYKDLFGTHGQYKITNGVAEFMKISPKKNITEEDKKYILEYLNLYRAIKDTGLDEKETRKETYEMLQSRYPEIYKKIIEKAEDYLYAIDKEKTEEEKLLNPTIDYKDDTDEPSYVQYKLVKSFDDFIQKDGENIKGINNQIKKYLEQEKVDLTPEEFKKLQNRVMEWDKNRNK